MKRGRNLLELSGEQNRAGNCWAGREGDYDSTNSPQTLRHARIIWSHKQAVGLHFLDLYTFAKY